MKTEKQSFYQSKVSPEAYAAHLQRMQEHSDARTRKRVESRGGDEGNIADSDMPPDVLARRNATTEK